MIFRCDDIVYKKQQCFLKVLFLSSVLLLDIKIEMSFNYSITHFVLGYGLYEKGGISVFCFRLFFVD